MFSYVCLIYTISTPYSCGVEMNFLNGLTLLLIYQLIGEVLSRLLQLSIPGPVVGMLLLFLCLFFLKKTNVILHDTSSSILSHLSLLFIPAGVGLMTHLDRLEQEWLPITAALVLGAIISFITTAWLMQLTINLINRNQKEETSNG